MNKQVEKPVTPAVTKAKAPTKAKAATKPTTVAKIFLLNEPENYDAKSYEMGTENGNISLVAKYQLLTPKNGIVTPALDLSYSPVYYNACKAFQAWVYAQKVVKDADTNENIANTLTAQGLILTEIHSKLGKVLKIVETKEGRNIILTLSMPKGNIPIGVVRIGPKGGVQSIWTDSAKLINNIVKGFDTLANDLLQNTFPQISGPLGQAYKTMFECLMGGKAIPKQANKHININLTCKPNPTNPTKNETIVLNLETTDVPSIQAGTFGIATGNPETRVLTRLHMADLIIPCAATIEVMITREPVKA